MTFTGIPVAALDFYEDLEADNSRAFWTAHKHVYDEQVRAPMESLATELAKKWGGYKYFRPYRDVRFSKDKTPYKTHQGIWFGETKVYVQVGAAGLWLAAGYWHTESAQVQRLRRAVDDDVAGAQLVKAVAAVERTGWTIGGHTLSRVPSGFDRDHPRGELLRHRTLTASRDLECPAWLSTPAAKNEIAKLWRGVVPLVTWLDTHVGTEPG